MKKNLHLFIDYDISNKIEKLAREENITATEEYEKILNLGLIQNEQNRVYDFIINSVKKNTKEMIYIKSLLQQVYADLRLEQINPKESVNLENFNNKFRKEKNKLID